MDQTVDAGKVSTWVRFRPSLCPGCHALCCTLPVEVSVADLQRMELITPEQAALPLRKIARPLIAKGLVRSFRVQTGLLTLEQRPNGDCVFLDETRLCRIYDKRPQVCRKFPKLGPKPGYCPSRRKAGTGSQRPSTPPST